MSNEKKWTPGPWYLDGYGNLKSDNGECTMGMVGFSGLCLTSGERAKANTKLAAAAPELYNALTALIKATEHLKPCPGTLDDARKALAKARGD